MATNIIKIIDSQDKVVSQTQVASGKSITVSAKEGQSYEFVSGATKRAPDEIKTTREGNNLKVEIKDGDATSTTIIEDYYTNGEGDLVGLAEDGHFYNFVPEEMGNDYMVTDLADGVSSFQALGSEGDSMSPWWLGLPLLALGAAGGGGGSGAANTLDTTAPDAPSVTMVTDDYDRQVVLSDGLGNDDIWGADVDTGSWALDSTTGEWSVNSGNVNLVDGVIVTNDATPTFTISEKEAGSTIEVYDYDAVGDTYTLVESTMVENPDGTWSVTVEALSDGKHTLSLVERDAANNVLDPSEGTQIDITVDTVYPIYTNNFTIEDNNHSRGYYDLKPGVDPEDDPNGVGEYTKDNYYFSNEFTLSDQLGSPFYGGNGTNPIYNSVQYEEGDCVYIELKNSTTGDIYHIINSTLGVEASAIVDDEGKWSVDVNSATVYVQDTSGAWIKIADGDAIKDGEYSIQIAVVDSSGNVTYQNHSAGGYFAVDTTAPEANSIESFARDGNNLKLQGQINNYQNVELATDDSESGNDIYDRDYDVLTSTEASKLYIYRSDDDGVSYHNVGEVNVGQKEVSDWDFTDATITEDGVYIYKVETLDVAGNSSLGEAFYAVVDADRNGEVAIDDVVGTAGNDVFQTDITANLDFKLDGGEGIDTLVLKPTTNSTLVLDSHIANFEIYDLGASQTLTINGDVNADLDYIVINGKGTVDLSDDWGTSSATETIDSITYHVYSNTGSDDLYIQDGVSVI